MEQERKISLTLRQIRDIQAQADKIMSGDKSSEIMENFARYSTELKNYIAKNIQDEKINLYVSEIPNVNYSRNRVQLWQYLIFPLWWLSLWKDIIAKNKTIKEISVVRGKYAQLELLIRGSFSN